MEHSELDNEPKLLKVGPPWYRCYVDYSMTGRSNTLCNRHTVHVSPMGSKCSQGSDAYAVTGALYETKEFFCE